MKLRQFFSVMTAVTAISLSAQAGFASLVAATPQRGLIRVKMINIYNSQTFESNGECRIQQVSEGGVQSLRIMAQMKGQISSGIIFNFVLPRALPSLLTLKVKDPSKAQVAVIEDHGGMMFAPSPNDKNSLCALNTKYDVKTNTFSGNASCVNVIAAEKNARSIKKQSILATFSCPLVK